MGFGRDLAHGAIAGAAGTVALNALTYLDMAVRGRPASPVPAQAAQQLAARLDVDLASGDGQEVIDNRSEGLGALLGYASGLCFGVFYGIVAGPRRDRVPALVGGGALTVAAMVGANAPPTVVGITDPRTWSLQDWLADLAPHLVYGYVTASVFRRVSRDAAPAAVAARSRRHGPTPDR